MSGYDFNQEYANALLEEADRTIEGLEARLRMSDSALTEATESIVQMREQIATLTWQRDLAVEAIRHCIAAMGSVTDVKKAMDWPHLHNAQMLSLQALDAIKESEGSDEQK